MRYVSCGLQRFHVLVGPNASGKSTFLDVPAFLGDFLRAGLIGAVEGNARLSIPHRARDAKQLTWMREREVFELAIEVVMPPDLRKRLKNGNTHLCRCRYEIAVDVSGPLRVVSENLWLRPEEQASRWVQNGGSAQRTLFPEPPKPPESIVHPPRKRTPAGWKKVIGRGDEPERVTFSSETSGWHHPFRVAADKAALGSVPEDEERFPVATWFRELLTERVQRLVLSSEAMRLPSPPGRARGYLPDGSNLPWVVHALEKEHPGRLKDWVAHVREALPDIERIETREREEDRHRYLVLKYKNGLVIPSWLVSDGTLRLLALTLLAYIPDVSGIYLVEEPENGIHPRAVETVYQSLSSVYGAQVLLATHSPVMLSMASAREVLCFARDEHGATDIVSGDEHPTLKEWRGKLDLGTLLASGILG
ncbi:MAG TPA: ATP-binding protein [Bryobacteraceae bacterium]|nr:ATP-binding protein [Bryobacteraceae bacterium]